MFPIIVDIFPKPIKIPKFVALVFEVQSAIKIENIKTDQPASTTSVAIIAAVLKEFSVSGVKVLTIKNMNA